MAWTLNDGVYTVEFSELNDLLQSLPANTVDTPYKLNITGLTQNDVRILSSNRYSKLNEIIKNDEKYVDLRPTTLPSSITYLNGCFLHWYETDFAGLVYCFDIPNGVTDISEMFSRCSNLKQAPSIPSSITGSMINTFYNCSSLVEPPETIPAGVTEMYHCFMGCTSLTSAPNIPDSVVQMRNCFRECTLITEVNLPQNILLNTVETCFYGCTSLKKVTNININYSTSISDYKDNCFYGCTSLESIEFSNIATYRDVADNKTDWGFSEDTDIEHICSIPFSKLDTALQNATANTAETAYPINVTGLTTSDIGQSSISGLLGNVIKNNNTKFVDLSLTELPDSVINMTNCFENCTSLTTAPNIPDSVTNIRYCFYKCSSLTTAPNISDSVTDMYACFSYCTSLTTVPNIPDSVIYMTNCFYNCSSLTTAPNISDSVTDMSRCFSYCTSLTTVPNIPDSVTDMSECFYNCPSLETIESWELTDLTNVSMTRCFSNCTSLREIKVPTPIVVEDTEYKLWKIQTNATTNIAKVTVYNADGTVKLSETQVPYSANANLTITGRTDELGFAPVGSLTNELIEKMLSYKTQITSDINRLNPDKKNFAMYAESPANFHSNIIFPDGVTADCTTGASEENKVITLTKWTDTELPARCEIDVTFTHGNTYGETTASTPTHPKLVVKNATNTTIGTFDICDSRGHYAGKGFCNDGDLICFKRSGNKMLIMNHDVRESTSDYHILSDGLIENNIGELAGSIKLPNNRYWEEDTGYGLDANNSSIIGANNIVFNDTSDKGVEGLIFPRNDGTELYQSIWCDGTGNPKLSKLQKYGASVVTVYDEYILISGKTDVHNQINVTGNGCHIVDYNAYRYGNTLSIYITTLPTQSYSAGETVYVTITSNTLKLPTTAHVGIASGASFYDNNVFTYQYNTDNAGQIKMRIHNSWIGGQNLGIALNIPLESF